MLLSLNEMGKRKASLTLKCCSFDLKTVHILLTLIHYHYPPKSPFTLKPFIFQNSKRTLSLLETVHLQSSNFTFTLSSFPLFTSQPIHITFHCLSLNLCIPICRKRVIQVSHTSLTMMKCKPTSTETSSSN